MVDVVGTAYVRIKALTDKLSKDIEDSVKKGMKDAKLDKISADAGDDAGESFGGNFGDTAGKEIKSRIQKNLDDDSIFEKPLARLRKNFKNVDIDFGDRLRKGVEADNDSLRRFSERLRDIRLEAVDLDELPFFKGRFLDGLRDRFDRIRDSSREFFARTRQNFRDFGDEINNGELGRSLDKLQARLKSLGGSGAGLRALRSPWILIAGAIVGALPYIQDAGAAILAYATGLVAQIGFLTTAVAGLGVAAVAAIGSAATAALPIFLAFKAETSTLEEFKDSMKAAGEEFLRIGVATQQTLLPALDRAVFTLGDLIPMFSEYGLFVGRAIGDYAEFAANVLVGEQAQGRFQSILQSSLRILEMLLPTLLDVGDILSGIWVAAIPASERFVGSLGDVIRRWRDMINTGLATGSLEDTFNRWYDRAEVLGSALADLSGALFDILQVGADSSDSVFERFSVWAEEYRAWTSSEVGQNRLKLIFDNALAVMHEVNGVVADLFDGIFGRLGEVGGVDSMVEALQRFREVLPAIQEGWGNMYDTIKEVVEVVGSNVWEKLRRTWEELSEPLGRLAHQLLDFLDAMNESGAFEVFLDLMRNLTDILSTLLSIPGFGTFVGYLVAFGTAAKVANLALGPFIGLFGKFSSLLITLIRVGAGGSLASMGGALGKLAAGFSAASSAAAAGNATGLLAGLKTGASNARGFSGAIGGAAAAIGSSGPLMVGLGAAGAALAVGGIAFFNHQQKVQRWKQEVRQATEALGLLNGGLNITAEGIAKYVSEFSRFESRDQLDDIARLGFSVDSLAESVATGTISYRDFAQAALDAGEIALTATTNFGTPSAEIDSSIKSLDRLQAKYQLTGNDIQELLEDGFVSANGVQVIIERNDSLIESFDQLYKAMGQAAKDNVDSFVSNAQNQRLLGPEYLNELKRQLDDIDSDDAEEAVAIQRKAQQRLTQEAKKSTAAFEGLSEATRQQVREQSTLADGTIDVVKENQLLYNEYQKQGRMIRENLELFASTEFMFNFGPARASVLEFSQAFENINFEAFKNFSTEGGIDELLKKFPDLAGVTGDLFNKLANLPEAEFKAAATALNVDADSLRDAMNGASEAIANLQTQALNSLPTIGQLLDEATGTTEDGDPIFNPKKFEEGIKKRTEQTRQFADDIKFIKEKSGADAAMLAAQQGPEAARNLATAVGAEGSQVNQVLADMEAAEEVLKNQIRDSLGPEISLQYLQLAEPLSESWGIGLGNGINSPATLEALKNSSTDTLNYLARGFQGHFQITNGRLEFVHTGKFRSIVSQKQRQATAGSFFSSGGFVGQPGLFGNPKGTDTVPAWLTPGEFVLRRAVAQAIPPGILESLNAGNPNIIGLLNSLERTRPGTPGAVPSTNAVVAGTTAAGSNLTVVNHIQAPTPLESARQISDRLRILQSQLTRR